MRIQNVWGANKVYYGRCANGEWNPVPFVRSSCYCGCGREESDIKKDGNGSCFIICHCGKKKNSPWHLEQDNFISFIALATAMFGKHKTKTISYVSRTKTSPLLNITNKANSTLCFVKRSWHHCPQKVKDQAYKSLVRPRLEYGCTVWDPYRACQKSWLEQVQRRAARFVTRTYTREEGCVTNALRLLNWPTLEKRRQVARLTLMYKCVTNQAAIDIPCYVHHQSSLKTRASHPLKFIPLQPSCDTYKYSFWPRTIIAWNSLPSDFLTMDSTAKFKSTISDFVFSV